VINLFPRSILLGVLSQSRQDQFLRAAYWLNHARRVWELSASASFVAIAQAIEGLLPEAETVHCHACGISHQNPSISKQFADWVEANVLGADDLKALYRLRSCVVHGSALLDVDIGARGLHPQWSVEMDAVGLALRATRVGLANWLRVQAVADGT
jgi:hypothetical protein